MLNGQLIDREQAHIAPDDRGFRYGDGLFETIRIKNGTPYQWDFHMARLTAGLKAIRIQQPAESLKSLCDTLLAANGVIDGLLRIQITRGIGGRGYLPDRNTTPTMVIETLPLPTPPAEPVSLWLSSYEKTSSKALPIEHKLAHGLGSTLARMEAEDHGCFDALQLNAKGEICETSSGNIFWLKDGIWHTPALSCGVLNGSTRAAVLRLLDDNAQECAATLNALHTADAVFICNTAWGIIAVNSLLPLDLSWQSSLHVRDIQTRFSRD